MSPHPTSDVLLDLALQAKSSPPQEELVAHLQRCDRCRSELRELHELLSDLPSTLRVATSAPAARERLLDEVACRFRHAPFGGRVASLFGIERGAADALLEDLENPSRWRRSPFPGITLAPVPPPLLAGARPPGHLCTFLRGEPGTAFPKHRHLGPERVLVLEGAYRDDRDGEVSVGDEVTHATTSEHAFEVTGSGPCICAIRFDGGFEVIT